MADEKRYLHHITAEEFREIFHEELFGAKRGEEDPNENIKVIVSVTPKKGSAPVEETKEEQPAEEPAPVEETKEEALPREEQPKAEAPEEEVAPAKVLGKFEIYPEEDGFKYRLKANNGEILVVSSSYSTREGAHKGIETFRKNVDEGELLFYTDKNDFSQWRLFSSNGARMIASGEFYPQKANAESSFESVKRFYMTEKIVDLDEIPDKERREWVWKGDKDDDRGGGRFELFQENEKWQARLVASNGELLFTTSNAYASKESLKQALFTIIAIIRDQGFTIRKDKQGRFQFAVTGANGVMVLGESYGSSDSARSAANSVLCFLNRAEFIDPSDQAEAE